MLATYLLKHFLQIFVLVFFVVFFSLGSVSVNLFGSNRELRPAILCFFFSVSWVSCFFGFVVLYAQRLISGNFLCSPPQPHSHRVSPLRPHPIPPKPKAQQSNKKKDCKPNPKGEIRYRDLGPAILLFCFFVGFVFCFAILNLVFEQVCVFVVLFDYVVFAQR